MTPTEKEQRAYRQGKADAVSLVLYDLNELISTWEAAAVGARSVRGLQVASVFRACAAQVQELVDNYRGGQQGPPNEDGKA